MGRGKTEGNIAGKKGRVEGHGKGKEESERIRDW